MVNNHNDEPASDITAQVITGLAEQFTQGTLAICEEAGLTAFEHAVALAVAAEHAQIALKRFGTQRGGTEDDWLKYCAIRDGFVELLRESAKSAEERARGALG